MGLDIFYYSKLQHKLSSIAEYEILKPRDQKRLHYVEVNQDFVQYTGGLKTGFYSWVKHGSFCGGSYRLYNEFRKTLCLMANHKSALHLIMAAEQNEGKNASGEHFFELIYFADHLGILGTEVSQILYRDFYDWRSRISLTAAALPLQSGFDYGTWFMETYDNFFKAFRIASYDGCVYFS